MPVPLRVCGCPCPDEQDGRHVSLRAWSRPEATRVDTVGDDAAHPRHPPSRLRRHRDSDVGHERREHLGEAEQQHPQLLLRPRDAQRLLEAGPVHRAHMDGCAATPQPVVVAVRMDDVVAGIVDATQGQREPECLQRPRQLQLAMTVLRPLARRTRREHVHMMTPTDERVRELVRLVPHTDLAPARQVVRDHRDPQRTGVDGRHATR